MPDSPQIHHPPPPPPPPPTDPAASTTPNAPRNSQVAAPVQVKPRMIIKGMLGRYERWNPVHPTVGTFWGIGLGLGCGVGWGPGFGPEVIGYVGAGCGVGFSVGVTLAGVGVGLPQHGLIRNQYHSGILPLSCSLLICDGDGDAFLFFCSFSFRLRRLPCHV
ncbi:Os07g0143600 [Oryza sativa Japonica Group]|uniref:Os07g0143600 protein n=1 Tax=Oryza sativa subsp. japonica TaxID=39947 RepID=Q0D8N1_ORYSJ|nr:Os07g0143600 [Oryza sativa Japonica Group]|eukprot:NP_001058878.2 Os07g0143600 [Oryza sativa Japonica Group]